MKICHIVGARPNFMKIAPLIEAAEKRDGIESVLIHTGQHYDREMSSDFFRDLNLPEPDMDLGVGSSSHGRQTGEIMIRFERVLPRYDPDVVIVVGDVNSTVACALVAVKKGIAVAHVEAGLRSYDFEMPEEINRVLTDRMSDFLFTTSKIAVRNLGEEGIDKGVHFVGNVMIDTLLKHKDRLSRPSFMENSEPFSVLTLHRPSNVDDAGVLSRILDILEEVQRRVIIYFPVHPRTEKKLNDYGLLERARSLPGLRMLKPVRYTEFLYLIKEARFVMTDSGGIQEETTVLGVPCLTMRENTERPETMAEGTNELVGTDGDKIRDCVENIIGGKGKSGRIPEKWDGKAAGRIMDILCGKME